MRVLDFVTDRITRPKSRRTEASSFPRYSNLLTGYGRPRVLHVLGFSHLDVEYDAASIYDPFTSCALLMSATSNQKRLPRHAILNSQASVESAVQATNAGYYNLLPGEKPWRDRQPFLKKLGYLLRPRYSPDWKPSWIGTTLQPAYCEDSVMLQVGTPTPQSMPYEQNLINSCSQFDQVIDAARVEDGERVAIKVTQNDKQELQITHFLSSIRESQNHCIPIFQVLPDPLDSNSSLMVMPYLRPCNDPEFWTIGEVIDFIDQTVEVRHLLHSWSHLVLTSSKGSCLSSQTECCTSVRSRYAS